MQPGQTISPGGATEPPNWQYKPENSVDNGQSVQIAHDEPQPAQPAVQPEAAASPAPIPEPPAQPQTEPAPITPAPQNLPPVQQQIPQPSVTTVETPAVAPASVQATAIQQPLNDGQTVSWTASEFIAHDKSGGWYALLALGGLVLAAIIYIWTKDKVSTAVVIIVAILFGVAAARKPRQLQYQVNSQGINIGGKPYPYDNFRSFSIVQEGAVESIWFMPLKRFMPILSIYFDPRDGDKILDIISQYLPVEQRQLDNVDKLMHRLRF